MRYVFIILGTIFLLPIIAFAVIAPILDEMQIDKGRLWWRDIGCGDYDGRAAQICQRLSHELQWSWLGHAVIAPRLETDG